MKLIKDLFEDAEKERIKSRRQKGKPFITKRSNQGLREQWLLGKFSEKYNEKAQHKLTYAENLSGPEETSRNIPEFKIFDSRQNWVFDIEITEALDAGRKRTLEYRTASKGAKEVPEVGYLPVIQRRISEKCSKDYPRDTVLIIYLNIFSSIYDEFSSETFSALSLPEECNLLQIWLLDNGGDKILRLV